MRIQFALISSGFMWTLTKAHSIHFAESVNMSSSSCMLSILLLFLILSLQAKLFKSIHFRPCVISQFNSFQSFSNVGELGLQTVKRQDSGRYIIPFPILFDVEKLDMSECLTLKPFCDPVGWEVSSAEREIEVLKSFANNCLKPIFGENSVTFENKYQEELRQEGFKVERIAFGNADTWHGSPDLRIDQVYVVSTGDGDDEIESVSVEGKSSMKDKHINQVVATTITSSFISYNIAAAKPLNPEKTINSMLPCILVNTTTFLICMYDCVSDILLISTAINLHEASTNLLDLHAMQVLYMVVNHQKYLRKLQDTVLFVDELNTMSSHYQELCSPKTLAALKTLKSLNESASSVRYKRDVRLELRDITTEEIEYIKELLCRWLWSSFFVYFIVTTYYLFYITFFSSFPSPKMIKKQKKCLVYVLWRGTQLFSLFVLSSYVCTSSSPCVVLGHSSFISSSCCFLYFSSLP